MSSKPPTKRARTEENGGGEAAVVPATAEVVKDKVANEANAVANSNGNNTSDNGILDPLSPTLLRQSHELAKAYKNATPYPHGMIHNFCKDGFLEDILTELKNNSKVKFKETDLFRVYQSIDLGNLQEGAELATKMPALMKLKKAIYSPEYRAFVERITGLDPGTLTDEVDCAANCHAKGCHLLCHDDVIGTRKVSYIIYLTDPEPEWTKEDGGALELYDAIPENGDGKKEGNNINGGKTDENDSSSQRFVPGALPVKTILPQFNSMAYFVVQPGVSFHSVQEVFCDRPRLSLQGWYHAKETPDQIENATLQRLKRVDKERDAEGDEFEPMLEDDKKAEAAKNNAAVAASSGKNGEDPTNNNLSEEDCSFLSTYINAAYLTPESMNEIQKRFEEESSVKLRHFLVEEWNAKINGAFSKEDERDKLGNNQPTLDYGVGSSDLWKAVGPAHKQRFLQYKSKNDCKTQSEDNTGDYLHHLRTILFKSPAFGKWLGNITSLGYPLGQRGHIRRFRPGLDYTVAHYGILTQNSVLDATLCFCAGSGKQCTFDEATNELIGSDDDAIWESGDVGGFECYIAADDEDEDAGPDAEYDEEDDTKLLSVSACNNSLSLVYRDPGTMKFVKYVGVGAPSSRWDIALEYDVDSEETGDDDDNDAEH